MWVTASDKSLLVVWGIFELRWSPTLKSACVLFWLLWFVSYKGCRRLLWMNLMIFIKVEESESKLVVRNDL